MFTVDMIRTDEEERCYFELFRVTFKKESCVRGFKLGNSSCGYSKDSDVKFTPDFLIELLF